MSANEILKILNKLGGRVESREELNFLIKFSSKIARAYINRNYSRMSHFFAYYQSTADETALDAVAGLFCMDKEEKNYNIINSFNSWKPSIKDNEHAFFFINRIVASAVEQYLSEMLREADPVFSKIFNSVNYDIKKKGYKKTEFVGCKYIVKEEAGGFSRNLIDPESFCKFPVVNFTNREKYIEVLFNQIESLGFAPAIPLNLLVSQLKKIYMNIPVNVNQEFTNEALAINEVLKDSVKDLEDFLKQKYLDKGKLSKEETGYFLSALQDIIYDLRDGGLNPGIHIYLEKYIPGLHNHVSYEKYHNILEYLLKILKKNISGRLETHK
jgi:hypothetical protein